MLYACGLNPRNFTVTGAAYLQSEWPHPDNPDLESFPAMIWATNYNCLACNNTYGALPHSASGQQGLATLGPTLSPSSLASTHPSLGGYAFSSDSGIAALTRDIASLNPEAGASTSPMSSHMLKPLFFVDHAPPFSASLPEEKLV
jgi:hypothetical protein